jgi:ferrous iron transport protein B
LDKNPVIALIGNPNSGKSSLFNQLTGLRQKVGNFSGVTVERHAGVFEINDQTKATIVDFPGVYSLYAKSLDERVVIDVLANPASEEYPDLVVLVADAANLKRSLLLFTEISDLGFRVIVVLNMLDVAERTNQQINAVKLAMKTGVPVVRTNARTGNGQKLLLQAIEQTLQQPAKSQSAYFDAEAIIPELINDVKAQYQLTNSHLALHYIQQHDSFSFLPPERRTKLDELIEKYNFKETHFQVQETINRHKKIDILLNGVVSNTATVDTPIWTQRLDKVLLHPVWGYVIFLLVLLAIFQAVFGFAQYPMDMIDTGVAWLNDWLTQTLPASQLTKLLTEGLISGIGGVVMFIPQIAFLFLLISLLEETGYMARVMVIMDRIMRRFGLNGRSVVPLISGVGCAVPAILSTRSISNRKERLLTIMVTPLMSCSARLPIFTILIALVVPDKLILGIVGLQALTLLGLYLLGLLSALLSAWVIKGFIKSTEKGYFMMEMPTYKTPKWNNVLLAVWEGVRSFVEGAGKIIIAVSIVLWVLASYSPDGSMHQIEKTITQNHSELPASELANVISAQKLEKSYAGHFGKFIEPAIKPLGYDWKIGIALLTSFAAREVFVGTISTIYSIGTANEDVTTIKNKLQSDINSETGKPTYTLALSFSLLIFYVFAMMCVSTIAATYRETHGWQWPLIQFGYMTGLAYLFAFLTYQGLK